MGCSKDDLPSQKLEGIIVETAFFVFLGASCLLKPPKDWIHGRCWQELSSSCLDHQNQTSTARTTWKGKIKPTIYLIECWKLANLKSDIDFGRGTFRKEWFHQLRKSQISNHSGEQIGANRRVRDKVALARGCCRYHWTCWEILRPQTKHCFKNLLLIGWKSLFLMMMGYGTISNKLVLDRGFLVHINGMKSESKFFISPTLYIYFPSYGFAIKGIDSKSLWYSTDGLYRPGTSGLFGKGCGDPRGLTLHGDDPGVLVI